MKIAFNSILLIVFAAIQSTWIDLIAICDIKPNIFLIYVVIISCFSKRKNATIIGFFSGYILDLLIGKIWGLYALLLMILCFSVSSFYERLIGQSSLVMIFILVFVGTLITEFLYYFIYFTTVDNISLGYALWSVIIPECIYNVFASIPMFWLVRKIGKFLYVDKGESLG